MPSSTHLRALPVGYELSDYRIEGILGEGGFGITYLALDRMLNRQVAIKEYYPREFAVRDGTKTIRASGNSDDVETFDWGLKRFLEEGRLLARFEHPNIIAVRRFFEANGTAYLVMDYCDGEPLDEIVKREGPMRWERLKGLLPPLLDGLECIHQANFLHRDIKPANIYLRSDGTPVLLDFGAARQELVGHSRSVTSLATPGYAAFEQYSTRGKQGPWTDIYGLGATLYRVVTGEKPQDATDRILDDSLTPAKMKAAGRYPANVLAGIDQAMAVRPEQRPQTIEQWRRLLGLSSKEGSQPRSTPRQELRQLPANDDHNRRSLAWVIGVVLMVLVLPWLIIPFVLDVAAGKVSVAPVEVSPPKPVVVQETNIRDCSDCPSMVLVPAGTFLMGASAADPDGKNHERPQHRVTIARPFYVAQYEVTNVEWQACVQSGGCTRSLDRPLTGTEKFPIVNVNWFDAQAYVDWLSKKTGRVYRLLTESEWEYAARAGSSQPYPFAIGEDALRQHAWYEGNSGGHAHPVGGRVPNAFGLSDLLGNVYEWTQDCVTAEHWGAPEDGSARTTGDCADRIIRGGDWASRPPQLRSSHRAFFPASERRSGLGFRVARNA